MSATPSGPVHPCPVCGSPDQTCAPEGGTVLAFELQEEPSRRPPQGDGPLRRYVVDGVGVKLTDDDARRAGLLEEE